MDLLGSWRRRQDWGDHDEKVIVVEAGSLVSLLTPHVRVLLVLNRSRLFILSRVVHRLGIKYQSTACLLIRTFNLQENLLIIRLCLYVETELGRSRSSES